MIELEGKREKKKLIKFLDEYITKIENERTQYIDKVNKFWEYYEGKSYPVNFPWRNAPNYFIGESNSITNAVHARLMGANFNIKPFFIVLGREKNDVEKATKVEQFMDYLYEIPMSLYGKADINILNGLVEGVGVWKETFEKRTERKIRRAKAGETMSDGSVAVGGEEMYYNETVYNAPKLETLSIRNYGVNSDTLPGMNPRFEYHKEWLDWSRIEELQGEGVFENINEIKNSSNNKSDQDDNGSYRLDTFTDINYQTDSDHRKRKFPIYECWFFYDIDGDGKNEYCVAGYEKSTKSLVRMERSPLWHGRSPFITWCPFPRPYSFYGMSLIELMSALQDIINKYHNNRLQNMDLSTNKVLKAKKSAQKDLNRQEIYPGAKIFLNDPNDVSVFDMGEVHSSTITEENLAIAYLERLTGVSDYNLGRPGSGGKGKTATATLAVLQEGNLRFDIVIKRFQEAMKEMAYQTIQLCQQYYPENIDYQRHVLGQDSRRLAFEKISRDELMGRFDFIPQGTTMAINKVVKKQEVGAMYNLLMGNPLCAGNPKHVYNATRMMLVENEVKNYEDYIGKEEDVDLINKAGVPFPAMHGGQPAPEVPIKAGKKPGGGMSLPPTPPNVGMK
jgi:hypothetical protein